MDYLTSLIQHADSLRRRLLAAVAQTATSETFGSKVESIFSALTAGDEGGSLAKGYAHGFALMFLLAGVKGLQPIKGEPAEEWIEKWKAENPGNWHSQIKKLGTALPSSWGSELAAPLWGQAKILTNGDRTRAEDALGKTYTHFQGGAGEKIEGRDLSSATKYVKTQMMRFVRNDARKTKKERSLNGPGGGDDEEKVFELVDESASIEDMAINAQREHEAKKTYEMIFGDGPLKSALEALHPDALQYLKYVEDKPGKVDRVAWTGVNAGRKVVGDPIMKHPLVGLGGKHLEERIYPQSWMNIEAKMFDTIQKHMKASEQKHEQHLHMAAVPYNYDRREIVWPV